MRITEDFGNVDIEKVFKEGIRESTEMQYAVQQASFVLRDNFEPE